MDLKKMTYADFDKWLLEQAKNAPVPMDGSFGSVIPVTGLNVGFLGQVSRTGGGDPFIVSKTANAANLTNISFGDAVVLLPDTTGGTYRQFADFLANGGVNSQNVTTNSNTTLNPSSMNGLQVGMFVKATGIPIGTFITAVGSNTVTLSQAATASATVAATFGFFGGIAVREVKTQLTYPITPGASLVGIYQPGQITEALVRGSITVQINVGTPQAGGPVYLRVKANVSISAGVVGGFEAQPDGFNTIILPHASFKTGVIDGNNISEITLLDRVAV